MLREGGLGEGLSDRLQETVNGQTTTFTMDLNMGLTQVLSDGTYSYTYGVDRISQQRGSLVDYFLGDALGSVRQLADRDGNVTLTLGYDPYGRRSDEGEADTNYGFAGEYTDPSGMVYLRSRMYDPTSGRFTTRDSWQGDYNKPMLYNVWLYGYGNPVNLVDPDGHDPILTVLILLLGAIVLSGDTPTPETVAERQAREAAIAAIDEIAAANSNNSANALIEMFASDTLTGDTPQTRLETILKGTESGPGGQQFRGDFNDSGFAPEFQDGYDQVGHFLTAVGIGYKYGDSRYGVALMIGHEMYPDIHGNGSGPCGWDTIGKLVQLGIGLASPISQDYFIYGEGTDTSLGTILDRGHSWPFSGNRYGNSMADLRLSYQGWTLGMLIHDNHFKNNNAVAGWIKDNIAD